MVVRAYSNQRLNPVGDIVNAIRIQGADVLPPLLAGRPEPLTNKEALLYFIFGTQVSVFFVFVKALLNKHYTRDFITFYNSINDIPSYFFLMQL